MIMIRILSSINTETVKEYLSRENIKCKCISRSDIQIDATDLKRVNDILTSFEIVYRQI